MRAELSDVSKCREVLCKSTNPVFLLWAMVDRFTSTNSEVEERRDRVILEAQRYQYRPILGEFRSLNQDFGYLEAKDVAVLIELIDREFFGGTLAGK